MKVLYSLLFSIVLTTSITAQDTNDLSPFYSGGYLPGIMGVRDYVNPGIDGLFIVDYNIFLNADSFYDRHGNKTTTIDLIPGGEGGIPIDVNISGYINSLMFIYASPKIKFLGNAQYLFIAAPNYMTTNTGVALGQLTNGNTIDGGASGFGDITVAPIMLSWSTKKIDITAGYLFVAPTGRYETGADNNVGIGYWSHIIQAASYYYTSPEKSTAFMVMPTFEWHGNLKGSNVKPGDRFILEYGISQYLSERLEVTLQGGHAWQIGKDSGSDVYWDTNIKDQMSLLAAGLGYWIKPNVFYANAKYNFTYTNKQHFKTNLFQIELLIATDFLRKKAKE